MNRSMAAFALKVSPSPSLSPSSSAPSSLAKRRAAAVAARSHALATTTEPVALLAAASKRALSVSQAMTRAREKGRTAFIPYITAGDPDLETTAEALRLLDACGADAIELGMPFSNPHADGPVLRAAAARALAGGATVDAMMSMLGEVTPELSCPVVILPYFFPIVRQGAASFAAAAKEAGARGAAYNTVYTMKEITLASEGFVYLVSIDGVTGARPNVNPRVKDLLKEIKQVTNKAVVVGFGISTPDHVRKVAEWGADGVVIGSAMVKQLGEAASPREGLKRLEAYARSLKDAMP